MRYGLVDFVVIHILQKLVLHVRFVLYRLRNTTPTCFVEIFFMVTRCDSGAESSIQQTGYLLLEPASLLRLSSVSLRQAGAHGHDGRSSVGPRRTRRGQGPLESVVVCRPATDLS